MAEQVLFLKQVEAFPKTHRFPPEEIRREQGRERPLPAFFPQLVKDSTTRKRLEAMQVHRNHVAAKLEGSPSFPQILTARPRAGILRY